MPRLLQLLAMTGRKARMMALAVFRRAQVSRR
jgi:hypothetical protein